MNAEAGAVRRLLLDCFDDQDLRSLCFDYFPDVEREFTQGMTRRQMIHLLLAHCRDHGRLALLVTALRRERPRQFHRYFPSQKARAIVVSKPKSHDLKRVQPQLFICHARQDAALARRLAGDLAALGWPIWLAPDSIRPGEKWIEAISRGLDESGVFLLVLTESAVRSRWVRDEVNAAIELQNEGRMRLIPLQAATCRIPAMWRTVQRVPFQGDYRENLALLLRVLRQPAVALSERPAAPSGEGPQHQGLPHTPRLPGFVLAIETPNYPTTSVPLKRSVLTLGRHRLNDIILPAQFVSRFHARLLASRSGWQVLDLGGVNGCWLDGRRLPVAEPVLFGQSSRLRIGPYSLELMLSNHPG